MRAFLLRRAALAALVATMVLPACAQSSGPGSTGAGQPEARAAEPLVSVEWLSQNLGKAGTVILDVGAFTHYEKGHIPGAVKAFGPWQRMNGSFVGFMMPAEEELVRMLRSYGLDNDTFVVIYDEGMTSQDTSKSARALWTLHALGHGQAAILDGGFAAWEQAEKPVSREPAFPRTGSFSGSIAKSKVVDLAEVKQLLQAQGTVFLDARSPLEHFGHEKKSNVKRFGHIPGSRLWPASFMTKAGIEMSPSLMRDREELREMAAGVGIPEAKDATIVTYSNQGQQAALAYFVLHDLLGYDNVRVFDGSMLESAADQSFALQTDAWGFLGK